MALMGCERERAHLRRRWEGVEGPEPAGRYPRVGKHSHPLAGSGEALTAGRRSEPELGGRARMACRGR